MQIIDALVVEVGLDPTKYKLGKKEIESDAKRINEVLLKSGKEIEEQGKKSGESIIGLKNTVLGLFAAFTGVGVTSFLLNLQKMDAQAGRSAQTMEMLPKALAGWEGAAQREGAAVGSITGGLKTLTNALEEARATGDRAGLQYKFASLFNFDGKGGVDIVDRQTGKIKEATEIYLEMAKKVEGVDAKRASFALATAGVPSDVIPFLLGGRSSAESAVKRMTDLRNLTKESTESARELGRAYVDAMETIKNAAEKLYPILTWVFNKVTLAGTREFGALAEKQSEVSKLWWMRGSEGSKSYAAWKKANDELEKMEANFAKLGEHQARSNALPPSTTSSDASAISSIESGGNYRAIGPVTKSGDRAYGKYQVMGANIPGWTKDAVGRSMTPSEFLSDSSAQDAVFNHRFGMYKAKYGAEGASRAWFAGEGGMNNLNRTDALGTSVASYGARFMAASQGGGRGNTSSTQVSGMVINVYPPNGDADTISKTIRDAMVRNLYTQKINEGPN